MLSRSRLLIAGLVVATVAVFAGERTASAQSFNFGIGYPTSPYGFYGGTPYGYYGSYPYSAFSSYGYGPTGYAAYRFNSYPYGYRSYPSFYRGGSLHHHHCR